MACYLSCSGFAQLWWEIGKKRLGGFWWRGGFSPITGPEVLPTSLVSGPYTGRAPRALEGRLCLPDLLASVSPPCSQHDAGHRPNPQGRRLALHGTRSRQKRGLPFVSVLRWLWWAGPFTA